MADKTFRSFVDRYVPQQAPAALVTPSPALVVHRQELRAPYLAFGARDKLTRLDVRCRLGGVSHAVSYSYLLNITYDRRHYREFFLTVSGLTVNVKGRALQEVVEAIKLGCCEFIQEFDPEEFAEPEDRDAPWIDNIAVEVMRGGASGT